jgi:hypothetical protein
MASVHALAIAENDIEGLIVSKGALGACKCDTCGSVQGSCGRNNNTGIDRGIIVALRVIERCSRLVASAAHSSHAPGSLCIEM